MFRRVRRGVAAAVVLAACGVAQADVRPAGIFQDNMVLQRDIPLRVWGMADPGESVTVRLLGQQQQTTAGADGRWQVTLQPIEVRREPFEVSIQGKNQVVLSNVLAGDVWLCSGQSNMQWEVKTSRDAEQEIAAANYPLIRLCDIPRNAREEKVDDIARIRWMPVTPQTVPNFSAVGYYFGRHLHQVLDVPIGLIDSSWGGTIAEAWTDRDALAGKESLQPILDRFGAPVSEEEADRRRKEYEAARAAWEKEVYYQDTGVSEEAKGWSAAEFDDSGWQTMPLPSNIEAHGLNIEGAIWFRRTVDIPADWAGKPLVLQLGRIEDLDVTYFNGREVGSVGADNPRPENMLRRYTVPGDLVKAGTNTIAVRVFDRHQKGGISRGPLHLGPDGNDVKPINLAGPWKYRVERELAPKVDTPAPPVQQRGRNGYNTPGNLYNGMIHPLVPFGLKGAIWYQGESNTDRAEQYRELLPVMINNWRQVWGQGDFPFLIVQLANFRRPVDDPVQDSHWPELREAQLLTAQNMPNTGLAVIIDIGEAGNIHPVNKQDVGKRLGLAAEKIAYGRDVVHSGPTVKDVKIDGRQIIVTFDNVGSGLEIREKEGRPLPVGIAGADRKFVRAQVKIEGNQMIAWSDAVAEPVALRYAWSDNPDASLLYNREGLPASPFRTDDFPLVTAGKR